MKRAPLKIYTPTYIGEDITKEVSPINVGHFTEPYVRKSWLVDILRKERNTIRHHLKDERWKEDWKELKVCESLYSEMIYRLQKYVK